MSTKNEIISETLDYKLIDLQSDFGGNLGLYIGASMLYLYDISIYFMQIIITKLKSKFGSCRNIDELKPEPDEFGDLDQSSQLTNKTTSTSIGIPSSENSKILSNIQEQLQKLDNKINTLENKIQVDLSIMRKKNRK